MKGPKGADIGGRVRDFPASHPLAKLQSRVGAFAHLLPGDLIANRALWQRVERLTGDKRVVQAGRRAHLPALLLPILKRLIDVPCDILVSIPHAADPLAYALFRMAEASSRLGAHLAKVPAHESFGGSTLLPPIISPVFFTAEELGTQVPQAQREKALRIAEGLSQEDRDFLFKRFAFKDLTSKSFQRALNSNLETIVRWFMQESGTHFFRAAQPILAELISHTEMATSLRRNKRIMILDDVVNDGLAYDSVQFPLGGLAPSVKLEMALLVGDEYSFKEMDAVCGCFHNAWIVLHEKEWTGRHFDEVANTALKILWPSIKSEAPAVEEEYERRDIFSLVLEEILYEKKQIFAQRASWQRKWAAERYGLDTLSQWEKAVRKRVTADFIEELKSRSAHFAEVAKGRLEIEQAVSRLFSEKTNRTLLSAYLRSRRNHNELRPVSDLLVLLNC